MSAAKAQAPFASPPGSAADAGAAMHRLIAELYPTLRSITGDGVRQTLKRLGDFLPLTLHEIPSGTRVFDWTVPREWNVREAWIADPTGKRVVDLAASSLHVVGYSVPVRQSLNLAELRPHLHSLPQAPDRIPYRTSYYKEDWGFCLSDSVLRSLPEGRYEICIDATLADGHLTIGECVLPGRSWEEVVISSHACHPSLANDNLSGVAVNVWLALALAAKPRRFTYRFLFAPGTIGAITWLALNAPRLPRIRHGLVLAGVGDRGAPTWKRTRRGTSDLDRAMLHVLGQSGQPFNVMEFTPLGYDERQFNAPGLGLEVGCLTRTPWGTYDEYHTSADNLAFVTPESLADSWTVALATLLLLERNQRWRNTNPTCEPQLGRRGLYATLGGRGDTGGREKDMLWILGLSDGTRTLLDIAEQSGAPFARLAEVADLLAEHGLLVPA